MYGEVTNNKHLKFKFSECPYFSCSSSDGTLEPVTSSSPVASELLRANFPQAHSYSQLDRSNTRFPQLEFRAENPFSQKKDEEFFIDVLSSWNIANRRNYILRLNSLKERERFQKKKFSMCIQFNLLKPFCTLTSKAVTSERKKYLWKVLISGEISKNFKTPPFFREATRSKWQKSRKDKEKL